MSIKRLDPKARFRVISQLDEAVVRDEELKARYEKYLESLDPAELKLKEGQTPTYFILRPLTHLQLADLNSRYLEVDVEKKTAKYKNQTKMFLEMFDLCCEGMQDGDGPMESISSEELAFGVAAEIGSMVSLIATLGKNLKKV